MGHDYRISWVTEHLAVGSAPMSSADMEMIRAQGIGAIMNLCGEFYGLHEIETDQGFTVYFLELMDECAPDMPAMERALDWLQQTIRSGQKVMVHCRHGIGRTGTMVAAYFLHQGHDIKAATESLKTSGAQPSSYCQWKLLRDYQRKLKPKGLRQ